MSHSSPRWSGAGPLVGTTVEWFIQAVDATGNVAVTSNKSVGRSVTPVEPSGNIEVDLTGQQVNGWYTGDVGATISGAPGISYSLDGAPFTPGTSLTVTGTDIHSLDFQGSDGSHGSVAVPIDDSLPTVTVNDSYGFGQIAHAVCADSGSGIASCNVPDPLDTSSAGLKTISVRAEDRSGHVFQGSITYTVRPNPFIGFFSPVDNPPTVNVANAGSSVPVKFSLDGFRGLDVLWPGFPASQQTTCTGSVLDDLEEISPPGGSDFTYDAATDRYKYVWRTDRGWKGTCRQLVIRLRDGAEKRANFRFR